MRYFSYLSALTPPRSIFLGMLLALPYSFASAETTEACAALLQHTFPADLKLEVQSTKLNEADAFCSVNGIVNARTGSDGKHYGIGFEMRLPLSWNGRFIYQMNGGNDGSVVPAEGDIFDGRSARAQGYAVLSTNAGHDGSAVENQQYGLAAVIVLVWIRKRGTIMVSQRLQL